jgi:dolichol kinase
MSALLPPFGTPAGELARAAAVALAFGALFTAAELWRRRFGPPVEWTRKLVHVGGGVVSGTFPWLFASAWTVLALALFAAGTLALGRRAGLLRSVTGVERRSQGELWFPVGVFLLFALARHQPVFFLVALGVLVFADSAAALIGRSYGRLGYSVGEDRKSIEGSVVFLLVTFLAAHLTLLLGTSLDRAVCVLVAAQLALLATCVEAISRHGNDNLVVPLGTYYLLLKMTPHAAPELQLQLLAQLGLLALTGTIAWRTHFLTFSGAVAAHLVLYAAFSLGGPAWTLAPLGALAGFLVLDARHGGEHGVPHGGHQVRSIYHATIVAVLLLFADNSFATLIPLHEALRSGHPLFPLFVGALAAPFAIVALEFGETVPVDRHRPLASRASRAVLGAGLAILAPGLAAFGSHVTTETIVIAALVAAVAVTLHLLARGQLGPPGDGEGPLRRASLATLIAVLVVLPVHFLWAGIRPWEARP